MKTDFDIKTYVSKTNFKIKVIYAYRRVADGSVRTSCLLFIYNGKNPLPEELNLQTATAAGFAKCIPTDQFCKDTGRKLVLARAMKGELAKMERVQVWEQYHDYKYSNK